MHFDAVLFDMDGLLVDSEPIWTQVTDAFCQRRGQRYTAADEAACLGSGIGITMDYLSRTYGWPLDRDAQVDEVLDELVTHLPSAPELPGASALLEALAGSGIPVAVVSTGFPAGLTPHETKLREIEMSVAAGALEVDIVISRRHGLTHDWQAMYDEVKAFREACGPKAHLKAILATGELQTLENVARASWVCMMAGADFIKTSTGKETVNATLDVSLVMVRAIRDYAESSGHIVGYKPAGGIGNAKLATQYLALMKEELGLRWLQPDLFRFGASSLLTDIERQLEHHVTGFYSAAHRHALP